MLIKRRSLAQPTIVAVDGAVITAQAVEAFALRQTQIANLSELWAGCSLPEEVLRYEAILIKQALDTSGESVVRAAQLLGISHQNLSAILRGRHKDLQPALKLAGHRKRSIIPHL